jgi:hypothetical protein
MRVNVFVSVVALLAASDSQAWAYGEDFTADDRSTAHYDMARCAGFSATDSTAIAEADQVTDTLAYRATAFTFTDRAGALAGRAARAARARGASRCSPHRSGIG